MLVGGIGEEGEMSAGFQRISRHAGNLPGWMQGHSPAISRLKLQNHPLRHSIVCDNSTRGLAIFGISFN